MTERVVLSRVIEPKFPDRCAVCRRQGDLEWVAVRGEASGGSGYLKWLTGKSGSCKIPLHIGCCKKIKRRSFWRNIGLLTLCTGLAVGWFVMAVNKVQMPFEFNKLNLCIAEVILLLPLLIAEEILCPPAFEFRQGENILIFDFKDADYASEFARLNDAKTGVTTELIEEVGKDLVGLGGKIN